MVYDRIFPGFHRRLWLLGGVGIVFFAFLGWRLWQIQMGPGDIYDAGIARQSIRRILLEPVRGRIFAADGTALVDNRACYDLAFHPAEMRQPGRRRKTLDHILAQGVRLAALLHRDSPLTREQLETHLWRYPALPLTVFQDLTRDEMARVAEAPWPLPGVEIVPRIVRTYPYPGLAAHVLGFTGRRRLEDVAGADENVRPAYTLPTLVGRDGLELFYDRELNGRPGEKLVRVDILGYIHNEIGTSLPPTAGNDLILALDLKAQEAAEDALRGQTGALVAIDVRTGGILAIASSPSYDLAELTAASYRAMALDHEARPLLNRATAASYLPGSIMKPLVALAALHNGTLLPTDTVDCTGTFFVVNHPIHCWKTGGHGTVDLLNALEQSCNSYFMSTGLKCGFDGLRPAFSAAGFGRAPEIDLPGAADGFLPSRDWATKVRKSAWTMADTAFISIGQGPITITPLQAAVYAAALANGGNVLRPYLVQAVRDAQGHPRSVTAPIVRSRLAVTKAELATVQKGMWLVVNGDQATARAARTAAISLAGKTGTAEVADAGGHHRNAWFIGFAPAESPRYALAIVVERGQSGGHTASPIASRFFDDWAPALSAPVPAPPAEESGESPAEPLLDAPVEAP